MIRKKTFLIGLTAIIGVSAFMQRKQLIDISARLTTKWTGLRPEVKTRALAVLADAEKAFKDTPYTVHIFDGFRTIEKQNEFIAGGTSFVKNPLSSYHLWGLAVDFVFKDASNNWTWEPGKDCPFYDLTCHGTDWYWSTLGEIIEQNGFEWGGRWKSFDGPHAQFTGFGKTAELIAEFGTPDKFV